MSLIIPSLNSLVQPDDVLLLESSTDPDSINRRATVLADGVITLPAVGNMPVSGKSLPAVEQALTKAYQKSHAYPGIQVYRADVSAPHDW